MISEKNAATGMKQKYSPGYLDLIGSTHDGLFELTLETQLRMSTSMHKTLNNGAVICKAVKEMLKPLISLEVTIKSICHKKVF